MTDTEELSNASRELCRLADEETWLYRRGYAVGKADRDSLKAERDALAAALLACIEPMEYAAIQAEATFDPLVRKASGIDGPSALTGMLQEATAKARAILKERSDLAQHAAPS